MLPKQQQPTLTQTQADEACTLLAAGWSPLSLGKHFRVCYGAIWRLIQRDRATGRAQQLDEQTGTPEIL
jgi:hypothetical protein